MKLVHQGGFRVTRRNERIRALSLETVRAMTMEGSTNDTVERIKEDGFFVSLPLSNMVLLPKMDQRPSFTEACLGRARFLCWTPSFSLAGPRRFVEGYGGPDGPVTGKLDKYRDHTASTATAPLSV